MDNEANNIVKLLQDLSSGHNWKFDKWLWSSYAEQQFCYLDKIVYICNDCQALGTREIYVNYEFSGDYILPTSRRPCKERIMRNIMK